MVRKQAHSSGMTHPKVVKLAEKGTKSCLLGISAAKLKHVQINGVRVRLKTKTPANIAALRFRLHPNPAPPHIRYRIRSKTSVNKCYPYVCNDIHI